MDKIFEALSSPVRRSILAYLSEAEMTAGEIASHFNMSKPSISKHLSLLEGAGLVISEKRGQFVHYRLVRESLVNSVHSFLGNFCPVSRKLREESRKKAKTAAS